MSGLSETSLNVYKNFIKQSANTLTRTPIKTLRKELKEDCLKYGCPDVKQMSSLLSRERRRCKKVLYSADERSRNKHVLSKITTDLQRMLMEAESLKMEKFALESDLIFYKTALSRLLPEEAMTYINN